MKKYLSRRKKKMVLAALLTGLCLAMPWNRTEAVSSYTTPNGLIRLDYYDAGEGFTGKWYMENMRDDSLERNTAYMTSQGTLPDWQKERINAAADYCEGLLKHTKTAKQPVTLAVTVNNDLYNMGAEGSYTDTEISGQTVSVTTPYAVLNHGKILTTEDGPAGFIVIGAPMYPADSEQTRYDSPLSQDSHIDLAANAIHEFGHILGIWTSDVPLTRFSEKTNLYESHLYDWRGVQARPGMEIRTLNHEAVTEPYFDLPKDIYDFSNREVPYFSGRHVREVLDGAKLRTYDIFGEKLDQKVPGLPVSGNEGYEGLDYVDPTHIELHNGLMSHQLWRNYVSFTEAELALLQDLGYTIDRRDFFGRSVYGDGLSVVNDLPFYARNANGTAYVAGAYNETPYGMGLHIYGNQNTVFQNAPLMTKGMGAVGIRVDGYGNNVTVNSGVNIQADGLNGNGILIAYGKDHNITLAQGSRVTAAGEGGIGAAFDFGQNVFGNDVGARASYAAPFYAGFEVYSDLVETDGPLVTDFTVQGELSGNKAAIAVSDNAYVKNIHIGTGAKLSGDIVSRWVYDDDKITTVIDGTVIQDPGMRRQYDGEDELTTRLSFEGTGLVYDGNITGTENMRLFVSGDLAYGGTATVLSATVEKGGSLFGGIYKLVPDGAVQNESPAMGWTLPYSIMGNAKELKNVGLFTNHGTIGAASKDTMMKITGDLVSDGTLQAYAGGTSGFIDVRGKADINGSTLAAEGMLPGDTFTVLAATEGVTGTPQNNSEASAYRLGMLDETGAVSADGRKAEVTATAANNLDGADAVQNETYNAMVAMYNNLKNNGDSRVNEMRSLFSLSPSAAKEALSAISANTSAQSMAVAQRSMMTHHILSSRLNEAFMEKPVKVKLPAASLMAVSESNAASAATQNGLQQNVTEQREVEQSAANGKTTQRQNANTEDDLDISLSLLEPAENDIWLKFGKNWGDVKDGADYHSSTTMLGYDKVIAPNWRAGAFAGYSSTGFSDNNASNELKDTRFGLYAGYNKAGREAMAYLDYGWLRNKLRRGVMGLTANARYHSRILELGGEYLYDLHAAKNTPWHVRPYVNAQLSRLWQNGYSEEGAGVYNQVVDSKHNDYFGMGAGVEFKRYLPGGNYAIRAGVRHAFAGAEPKLRYSYMGDAANTYDMRNVQDKTHFVLSIGGEAEVAKGWSIGGDAGFTRGRHDKDFSCSVTVKRMW